MSLHTCSVCLATAVDPREVPCGNGHVFCLSCLQGLVTRAKTTEAFSFPCPCCHVHIDIPPGGVECFPSVTIPSESSSRPNVSTNSGQASPYVQSAVNSPSHASIRRLLGGSQCQREHAESDSDGPQRVSPPNSPSPGRFSEYNLPVTGQGDDQTQAVSCPVHAGSGSPECRAPQTLQATPAADGQPSFKPYFQPGSNTESSSKDEAEDATPSSTTSLEDDTPECRSSDADQTDAGNRAVPHRPDHSPQMTGPSLPVIFSTLLRAAWLQQSQGPPATAGPVGPPGAYGFPRPMPGTANQGVPCLPTRSPVFGRFPHHGCPPCPPGYHRHPCMNRTAPRPARIGPVHQRFCGPAPQDEDTAEGAATASKVSEDLDMKEVMLVIAQMESQQHDAELSQQDIEAILMAQFDDDSQHSPVSGDSH